MVYAGEYAMGSWTWGEMGGVAIAKQQGGSWVVVCGTGGAFSKIEELQTYCGIPYQSAQALLQKWLNAQSRGTRGAKTTAYVYDPPSNIRFRPNGDVVCQVTRRTEINIYNYSGGWYSTDYCGSPGYIHESQVNRVQGLDSRSVCNVVGIERGQLALRFAPGGDSRAGLNNGNAVRILRAGSQPWVYVRVVNGPNRQVDGLEGWVNRNYLYCP